MKTAPPICKSCKHYQFYPEHGYEICGLRARKINHVTGNVVNMNYDSRSTAYCSYERSFWWPFALLFRKCGTMGQYFELKADANKP